MWCSVRYLFKKTSQSMTSVEIPALTMDRKRPSLHDMLYTEHKMDKVNILEMSNVSEQCWRRSSCQQSYETWSSFHKMRTRHRNTPQKNPTHIACNVTCTLEPILFAILLGIQVHHNSRGLCIIRPSLILFIFNIMLAAK